MYIVEKFSGECRVLTHHHQATGIKVPVTVGPLFGQANRDLCMQRRS